MRRLFRLPWRGRDRIRDDIEQEIAFHLEMRTEELIGTWGMDPQEARTRAEAEFGDVHEARRALGDQDERLERRIRWRSAWSGFAQDLRFAGRSLRKRPLFSGFAVLTIALAIGATTLVFTVFDNVLLRPLPYPDSDRLVDVWQTNEGWSDSENPLLRAFARRFPASYPVYEEWQAMVGAFSALGAYARDELVAMGDDRPERLDAFRVTAGVFRALRVEPQLGRVWRDAEDRLGGPALAVLSDGLWQRRFGGDPEVVGRPLSLGGTVHTIAGVMPRGFYFPEPGAELWLTFDDEVRRSGRGSQGLRAIARLRDDASLAGARDELDTVTRRIAEAYPDTQAGLGARLAPRLDEVVGDSRASLAILLAASGLLLAVACANLMNMLFARATMRGREIAVRSALGAGRARIVRSMMTESGLLAAAGGAVGVLAALLLIDPLVAILPEGVPRTPEITVDGRVLTFAVAVTLGAAVIAGLLPALSGARSGSGSLLRTTMRTMAGGRRTNRLRAALVVSQLAMAVVLVVAAGLLGRSLARLGAVDPGFEPGPVVLAELVLGQEELEAPGAVRPLYESIRERVAGLPGIAHVGFAENVPFFSGSSSGTVEFAIADGELVTDDVAQSVVTDGYLETVGIPLVRGRGFGPQDREGAARVAMVNRAFVQRHWPDVDPIGRRLRDPPEEEWRTVVGVVEDIRDGSLTNPPSPRAYRPLAQVERVDDGTLIMAVRAVEDAAAIVPSLRDAVWEGAPAVPIPRVARLDAVVDESLAQPRFRALLIGSLALLAAFLGIAGVYALVAFSVLQRRGEMGVRLALGASPGRITREILGDGLRFGVLGLAFGVPAAIAGAHLMRGFLFEVGATDPVVLGGAAALVTATAVLAAYLPARRASEVDPSSALRAE